MAAPSQVKTIVQAASENAESESLTSKQCQSAGHAAASHVLKKLGASMVQKQDVLPAKSQQTSFEEHSTDDAEHFNDDSEAVHYDVPHILSLEWGEMSVGFKDEVMTFKDCVLTPQRAENWDWRPRRVRCAHSESRYASETTDRARDKPSAEGQCTSREGARVTDGGCSA